MSQAAEKTSSFLSALERRPQGGPRWLEDLRSRGAAKFAALGIPTVRDEEWRFTNLPPLPALHSVPAQALSRRPPRPTGVGSHRPPPPPPGVHGRPPRPASLHP